MSVIRVDEVGGESLERLNKLLAGIPGGAWRATSAALKRAGDTAKTKAGQYAAAEYTITKGDFMRNTNMKTHMTGDSGGVASLNISFAGKVLPLLTFQTRYGRDGLITTKVMRNGETAALQHVFAERVFGPIAVFERTSPSRFPVEQKFGPSTGHMMQNENVVEEMDETIRDTFEKRAEHEILRVLNGWGGMP